MNDCAPKEARQNGWWWDSRLATDKTRPSGAEWLGLHFPGVPPQAWSLAFCVGHRHARLRMKKPFISSCGLQDFPGLRLGFESGNQVIDGRPSVFSFPAPRWKVDVSLRCSQIVAALDGRQKQA